MVEFILNYHQIILRHVEADKEECRITEIESVGEWLDNTFDDEEKFYRKFWIWDIEKSVKDQDRYQKYLKEKEKNEFKTIDEMEHLMPIRNEY